ncbi:type II CAAX endopeptidase family protein [Nocardia goodfellowii]|uniref:Membrane protease YdiL (CAAX protease family) n=1 Tax=Nocardia goodfellowii TaxID=882446 RepID=A0ABS4QHC5_9NOCA|nr:type II CAAX endopeptidase family protein [Nocardia goodfellowii]MBP2190479.1 membrane protease YdiL (CAAX protease family) [Nocardia goodfellowii]
MPAWQHIERQSQHDKGLRPVLVFFALAFVLTWMWWIPAALIERGTLPLDLPWIVLMIPGGLGPLLAALICSSTASGGPGVRPFLRHAFQWRSAPGFYVLATFGMAAMVLGTVPVHLIAGATWDSSGALAGLIALAPMFVFTFILGGGIDEEFGWRGYALPRLQAELPPWSANLLLGVAWSLWHLPLWWNPAVAQSNLNFPLYLLSTTGFSLVLGWLYNTSGGNVMLIVTAHTCSNLAYGLQSAAIDPVYQWINVAVMAGSGLLVLVLTRGRIGYARDTTSERRRNRYVTVPEWRRRSQSGDR